MGATDFDFLPGRWNVANRKLVNTLDPSCDEWEEFDGDLGRRGDARRRRQPRPLPHRGYEGFSLRLYDPERDVWRIWWSSTARPGRLDPPVEGRFSADGTARFETADVLEGIPIRMRFVWSEITGDSARWDQSFSFDDGATWVLNWTMSPDARRCADRRGSTATVRHVTVGRAGGALPLAPRRRAGHSA